MENEDLQRKEFLVLEKKKLASMGPDVVLIIPRKLIKYKVIDPEKTYNIYFEEVKKNKKKNKKEDEE